MEKSVTDNVTVVERVRLPLVPVIVSVESAAGVELDVVTVSVDEPTELIEAGLKLAVAPAGNPLMLRFTVPLKPFWFPTFTVKVVLLPTGIVCDAGVAETEKSVTTSVTVSLCVRLPLVPVTVSVKLPTGVEPVVDTLSVELPEPLTDAGLKLAV